MPTDRELAGRAAAAYVEGARAHPSTDPRSELDESGGLLRRITGSPVPYFNWLYVVRDDVPAAAVADAVRWFDERDQPFTVRLRDHQVPTYDPLLRSLGFQPELVMPGMVATPVPSLDAPSVAGLSVTRVADLASYDAFTAQMCPRIPGHWLTPAVYRAFMPTELLDDPAVAYFLGSVDGEPVATSGARVDDGVVAVFGVSTAEHVRRRGIGAALTAAALDWGRAAGADLAFLTSSDMARGMYERMGFRTVDTWHFYLRPWEPPAA